MKTIEFTLKPGGEVVIEPKGFVGKACLAATKPYEDALGGRALSDTPKPEMAQVAPAVETAKQGR